VDEQHAARGDEPRLAERLARRVDVGVAREAVEARGHAGKQLFGVRAGDAGKKGRGKQAVRIGLHARVLSFAAESFSSLYRRRRSPTTEFFQILRFLCRVVLFKIAFAFLGRAWYDTVCCVAEMRKTKRSCAFFFYILEVIIIMQTEANSFLGTERVGKLMRKFAVPCVISLLVGALYNIVDQIYIGWGVGYLGNGATNVVFPLTVLGLGIGVMIGDGCCSFVSIALGKKDGQSAGTAVGNAIVSPPRRVSRWPRSTRCSRSRSCASSARPRPTTATRRSISPGSRSACRSISSARR
jgi:hypothetical protein